MRRRLQSRVEPSVRFGTLSARETPSDPAVVEAAPRCGGVSHEDVAEQLPPAAYDSRFEFLDPLAAVRIIADNLLAIQETKPPSPHTSRRFFAGFGTGRRRVFSGSAFRHFSIWSK